MHSKPKGYDISRIIYIPDRDVIGFLIIMENIPGVLAKVSKVFWSHNVNILKVFLTSNPEYADGIFFCDFTDAKISSSEIAKLILDLKEVRDVKVIEPIMKGLVVDDIHFPLILFDSRCVILREGVFREIVKGMRDEWGSAAEVFLYHAGVRIGSASFKAHKYFTEDKREKIKLFQIFFKNNGLGDIEVTDIDEVNTRARVIIRDSIECKFGLNTRRAFSQFFRGIIAGVMKEFFKRDVEVKEVKCIAKGDPYCEFIVNTREERH